jgi:hypothetical protein
MTTVAATFLNMETMRSHTQVVGTIIMHPADEISFFQPIDRHVSVHSFKNHENVSDAAIYGALTSAQLAP